MFSKPSKSKKQISERIQRSIVTLVTLFTITTLISCGDFIDPEETPGPPTSPHQEPPKTPEDPPEPVVPEPKPQEKPKPGETIEQRNWRLCEAERLWAFNARIVDSNAYRLYQNRNFAPVFNTPGERQSGVEGWYPCAHALEMNGFIDPGTPSDWNEHEFF